MNTPSSRSTRAKNVRLLVLFVATCVVIALLRGVVDSSVSPEWLRATLLVALLVAGFVSIAVFLWLLTRVGRDESR